MRKHVYGTLYAATIRFQLVYTNLTVLTVASGLRPSQVKKHGVTMKGPG